MSAFENVRQRKLQMQRGNDTFRRTISIEADGTEYTVKIDDSRLTVSNYGLRDANDRNLPTSNVTPTAKTTPAMTLRKAVEFADSEFQRSIQHESFSPLAAEEDFTT